MVLQRFLFVLCFCSCLALQPWISLNGNCFGQASQDEGQRLSVLTTRLLDALDALGRPCDSPMRDELVAASRQENATRLQELLDQLSLCVVSINPESRVKVQPGAARPVLQQAGYVPWIIKIINQGAVKAPLIVSSPQAGPSYSGVSLLSMQRQAQLELRSNEAPAEGPRRFLHFDWFSDPPMARAPSGVPVEYAILLVYSSDAGSREIVLDFSVGQGSQDLGFRAQLPLAIDVHPAIPVALQIHDIDRSPTYAKLTIRDAQGHVYPPQPRRLAPDFFFQPHIYRQDGEQVLLPPGDFTVESSQGPETVVQHQTLHVSPQTENRLSIGLKRWVQPMQYGWYSGDHHIHGAGCAHYTSPTEGVTPQDMFRQVAGEGLNVGCVLTWGPCFEFQRQFFRPDVDQLSRPKTLMKYDIEISGFGSQALGHVCLLNLRDQYYPGSEGTKEKGWPTWATPALTWAKSQGAVTGFAHSASGLQIDPARAAARLMQQLDTDRSGQINLQESQAGLLPATFDIIDNDHDRGLSEAELQIAIDRVADQLPNLAIPEMNSVGAMELPVAVAAGVCDFISTMDTERIAEWNMWYHILNCGFPLKASGETDFPCMSGNAVGQGRVYIQLGPVERIDFSQWCQGLAQGRSYVSDGYAHTLEFSAQHDSQHVSSGQQLHLAAAGEITVRARVSLAASMPEAVAYGTRTSEGGQRFIGDTRTLHGPKISGWAKPGSRLIECVFNGQVVHTQQVACDNQEHLVEFRVNAARSGWLAIRAFPHLHTNPIEVLVGKRPIRASADSARWCAATIEQLWRQREKNIAGPERAEAEKTFQAAIAEYRKRADESE